MRVIVEAEYQDPTDKQRPDKKTEITFSEVGTAGWVRIEIDGRGYDIDYRDFWNAARSVCIRDAVS